MRSLMIFVILVDKTETFRSYGPRTVECNNHSNSTITTLEMKQRAIIMIMRHLTTGHMPQIRYMLSL